MIILRLLLYDCIIIPWLDCYLIKPEPVILQFCCEMIIEGCFVPKVSEIGNCFFWGLWKTVHTLYIP